VVKLWLVPEFCIFPDSVMFPVTVSAFVDVDAPTHTLPAA
jgi:hypothetical protein